MPQAIMPAVAGISLLAPWRSFSGSLSSGLSCLPQSPTGCLNDQRVHCSGSRVTNPPATPLETPEARIERIGWENDAMEETLRKIAAGRFLGLRTPASRQAAAILDEIDGARADTVG